MKKTVFLAAAAITLASCSSDELVNSTAGDMNGESPIAFSVEKKNITRGTQNLEATGHYNFGVWAYKYKEGAVTQQVMGNYLVGYSNETDKKGYEHSGASTWDSSAGSETDHKSPWFYEKLGTDEYNYTGTDGYYTKDQIIDKLWEQHENYLASLDKGMVWMGLTLADIGLNWKKD